MRLAVFVVLSCIVTGACAQTELDDPKNPKALKTYHEAFDYVHRHMFDAAIRAFKKADKQDDGHCLACQKEVMKYAIEVRDWKAAESAAGEMVGEAQVPRDVAVAHFNFGIVLIDEGREKHKEEFFSGAHEQFTEAVAHATNFPEALMGDGRALAYLNKDDEAKVQFQKAAGLFAADDPERERALRYSDQPELARARMAPAFAVATTDGQRISLDELKGKVVLMDFWATWCMPCRESIPHMRDIAKHFNGQPLVMLSVSLDDNEQQWKEFVAKNQMTWPQYRDGGFNGPLCKLFGVAAIPHTFTIDSDGILQDEHIGDAAIEGKLKKLIAHAKEMQLATKPQTPQTDSHHP